MNCERCQSPMQYTTEVDQVCGYAVDVDFWLCLYCGNEVITMDQIKINDTRVATPPLLPRTT